MTPELFSVVIAGLVGLVLGSFLNVCITRWPANLSVVKPRSRCPRCHVQIAWYDNIPVVSWLLLRGKCRSCALPIPVFYPAVELLVAGIWALVVWHYGVTLEAARAGSFATILLGIAMTDAREYIIPDEFSVGGAVLGVAFALAGGALSLSQSLLGAAVGFGMLWLVAIAGQKIFQEEAMGGGDIKMMALIGAFLGWKGTLLTIFLGSLSGVLIFLPLRLTGQKKLVPFGIFLAIGAAASWIAGDAILDWYTSYLQG